MATRLAIPASTRCTFNDESDRLGWSREFDFSVGDTAYIVPDPSELWYDHMIEYYEGDLVSGDTIFVVIANYSSGDSFGFSDREYVEICSINKDRVTAEHNLGILKKETLPEGVLLLCDDGTQGTVYQPWEGYFDRLDSLEIYEMGVSRLT